MAEKQANTTSRGATRALLVLNVLLLIALVGKWSPAPAVAQRPSFTEDRPQAGLVNPADQRREMIAQLRALTARVDKLNERLSRPLEVKVVQMPASAD